MHNHIISIDERLLFPLCYRCAILHRESNFVDGIDKYLCDHSDDERSFNTTTTHIELQEALRQGYRCTHLYRALHW